MKHIYLISGFGADDRMFKKLDFGNNELHFIPWKLPLKDESLEAYANRMRQEIHHENPVLVGLSFGGMLCIEIAKLIEPEKIILFSSVKVRNEMPFYMRVAGNLRLNKVVPLRPYSFLEPIENYNLGPVTKEEKMLLREYRKNVDPLYVDWAIDRILNWKNNMPPKNLFHFHGDKDRIFPIKYIHPDYVIKGGGHMMIVNRAEEVNNILKKLLE